MSKQARTFAWAVIGGGPAGIAALGKLIDCGIKTKELLWIDPHFRVGDLGQRWHTVSSNTSVARFLDFLHAVNAFSYVKRPRDFILDHLNPNDTCLLQHIVEPLQWVSDSFNRQVHCVQTHVREMTLAQRHWILNTDTGPFIAKQVILATGAVPKVLPFAGLDVIPFETAIDKEKLSQSLNREQTIAVFGSSHSAIIVIRYLIELGAKKVINFYRSPCRYAMNMGSWTLFDNTGLKGSTADWAREHINGLLPPTLFRYPLNEHTLNHYLPHCDRVIYAIGFERRQTVRIDNDEQLKHNPHLGIIAPGLFGLGIAYPESKADPLGNVESQVGLWKFMTYLEKVLPIWMNYTP